MDPITIVLVALLFVAICIFFYYVPFMLWINAVVSGVHISLVQLFLMRIRKVPPSKIVNCMIEAHKAGLVEVKRDGLEAHYLAGGHIGARITHVRTVFAFADEDGFAFVFAERIR